MVTAEGVDPVTAELDVSVGEQWDQIEVIRLRGDSWNGI
jgi:hypothetical protein